MWKAAEEADETAFWLEFLIDVGLVPPGRMQPLLKEASELLATFAASCGQLGSLRQPSQ